MSGPAGAVRHLDVLVEERSADITLSILLPLIIPETEFDVIDLGGRANLQKHLPGRLKGYATYADAADVGVVVLMDRDRDDCRELKRRLVTTADSAWPDALGKRLLLRIACEELEAWFFGDIPALRAAYPRLPEGLGARAAYRDPDAIRGGTAEALHRELRSARHVRDHLPKLEVATKVAPHMNIEENTSVSFRQFRDGVRRLVGGRF